ncbi:MAG: arylesterase [Salinisphaeraceae bacterium]|nr:arylesterase [Salinisphaeraceae bacterium]
MKKILSILYLFVAVAVIVPPAAASANDGEPTILVLGDSLSAAYGLDKDDGWVALMRDRLATEGYPHQVFNASISGETTSGGLRRLPDLLDRHAPQIVVLELGANDGLRALSLSAMRGNLKQMIQASREAGAQVLLLGMRIPQNYGATYADAFFESFQQLATQMDVAAVEFFLAPIALNQDYFQSDRLHPNAAAQPMLLDEMWDELAGMLPEKPE